MKICFKEEAYSPVVVPAETNLSEVLNKLNSPVLFGCRTGICGTCLVEVVSCQDIKPPTCEELEVLEIIAPEVRRARLACQLISTGDIELRYLGL